MTSTTSKVIRWYAHNTGLGLGVRSCGKCFSEPDAALPALLHATLRGRERMQLRELYTRSVGGLGRAVCAVLHLLSSLADGTTRFAVLHGSAATAAVAAGVGVELSASSPGRLISPSARLKMEKVAVTATPWWQAGAAGAGSLGGIAHAHWFKA